MRSLVIVCWMLVLLLCMAGCASKKSMVVVSGDSFTNIPTEKITRIGICGRNENLTTSLKKILEEYYSKKNISVKILPQDVLENIPSVAAISTKIEDVKSRVDPGVFSDIEKKENIDVLFVVGQTKEINLRVEIDSEFNPEVAGSLAADFAYTLALFTLNNNTGYNSSAMSFLPTSGFVKETSYLCPARIVRIYVVVEGKPFVTISSARCSTSNPDLDRELTLSQVMAALFDNEKQAK